MGARPLTCVEQGKGTHTGAASAGKGVLGQCRFCHHLSALPSACFSNWGQPDRVGADGVMAGHELGQLWLEEGHRRLRGESHGQLQASNFGAPTGAEVGASEDAQQQMVGWQ